MMKPIWTVALIVFLSPKAFVAGGSYVGFQFTDSAIIIAADSRITTKEGTVISDAQCKITRIGEHTIFASMGIGGKSAYGGQTESASGIAKALFEHSHDYKAIARAWGHKFIKVLQSISPDTDSLKVVDTNTNDIALGIFGIDDGTKLLLFLQHIELFRHRLVTRTEIFAPQPEAISSPGGDEYLAEYAAGQTARARALNGKLSSEMQRSRRDADVDAYAVGGAVEAVVEWSHDPRMHVPIDILVLRKGQPSYWIRHKDNCQ